MIGLFAAINPMSTAMLIGVATVLAALSMWLLLPRGRSGGKAIGAVLGLVSLGIFFAQLPRLAQWGAAGDGWNDDLQYGVFLLLAAVTIISAVAAVSLRSPVYCAIWFALTLLGTAGLFLYQGSQFLGVATVVVYAGAILVTFLFVLMLAQPEGHAPYDRVSWEALLSATTGAVMVGILTMTIATLPVDDAQARPIAELETQVLAPQHMARMGGELLGRHLVSLEVAGLLLFVALVGAVAIVAQEKGIVRDHDASGGQVAAQGRSHV